MMRADLRDLHYRKHLVQSALASIRSSGYEPEQDIVALAQQFGAGELTESEFDERCDEPLRSALRLVINESDPLKVSAIERLLAAAEATGRCDYETCALGSFRLCRLEADHFALAQNESASPRWHMLARVSTYSGMRDYLIDNFETLGPGLEDAS